MPRRVEIDEEKLLSVALGVFLELGIRGTAGEVARRAGVSEGSIFKRFPTKVALFQAAMRSSGSHRWPPEDGLEGAAAEGGTSVRDELRSMAMGGLGFFRQLVPLAMMSWSEPTARKEIGSDPSESGALRGLRALADYFRRADGHGRLAVRSPEAAAQVFAGALWNYVSMEVMFGANNAELLKEDEFVDELVEVLLHGVGVTEKPERVAVVIPSEDGT
jgi:AcrR family transcriptional regulator